MDKYDGMNKVHTQVQEASKVTVKKRKFGALKIFFVQLGIAAILTLALFSGKIIDIPFYAKITQTVKAMVGLDVITLIEEKLNLGD